MRLAIVISFCAVVAACLKRDPNYCPGAPLDDCAKDDGCTSNAQCAAPTSVCDVDGTRACVQCLAPDQTGACGGTTPVCAQDHTCQACTAHAQCASLACLPDGSCGDDTTTAYIDPTGTDNASCTKAMPCTLVSKALATSRPYVKFTGTTDEAVTIDNGRVVTFLADPGAKLVRTNGTGAIVTVRDDGTSLAVYDLSISDAPNNPSGIGIVVPAGAGAPTVTLVRAKLTNNPGGGISASGGELRLSQCTVSGNGGGGISISGAQFDITNNFIAKNGSAGSIFGGVRIDGIVGAGTRRFEFNTVAQNQATAGITPGVLCSAVATPLVLTNSIVYDNSTGTQVEGANCSWTYSDIGPTAVSGTGNFNAPPMFVNPMQNDFHLQSTSPARDAADPAASLGVDIDGDVRPQGAARDIGADEIR
jgi:hypothetical protein